MHFPYKETTQYTFPMPFIFIIIIIFLNPRLASFLPSLANVACYLSFAITTGPTHI